MFLITGCGRSGTKYAAQVLRLAGLDVLHEAAGKDGAVSSLWLADDPQGYPAYHAQERPAFDVLLLQTRHPLSAIASLTTALQGSWAWNARHIPLELPDPLDEQARLRTAASYWVQWNQLGLERCVYAYPVEDLEHHWAVLLSLIGHPGLPYTGNLVPKNTNTRRHADLDRIRLAASLPTQLFNDVLGLAGEFGYRL